MVFKFTQSLILLLSLSTFLSCKTSHATDSSTSSQASAPASASDATVATIPPGQLEKVLVVSNTDSSGLQLAGDQNNQNSGDVAGIIVGSTLGTAGIVGIVAAAIATRGRVLPQMRVTQGPPPKPIAGGPARQPTRPAASTPASPAPKQQYIAYTHEGKSYNAPLESVSKDDFASMFPKSAKDLVISDQPYIITDIFNQLKSAGGDIKHTTDVYPPYFVIERNGVNYQVTKQLQTITIAKVDVVDSPPISHGDEYYFGVPSPGDPKQINFYKNYAESEFEEGASKAWFNDCESEVSSDGRSIRFYKDNPKFEIIVSGGFPTFVQDKEGNLYASSRLYIPPQKWAVLK